MPRETTINQARKEILERAKNARTKVEKARIIVDVLHEMGLHDVPKEVTLEIADKLGVKDYHPHIRHALKIVKVLGEKPKTVEEVFRAAEWVGLGHLSEKTLLRVASHGLGIKETGSKEGEICMKTYAERIKKALGWKPRTIREVFEGAKLAGLRHLSKKILLNIASREFGIKYVPMDVYLQNSWDYLVKMGKELHREIYGVTPPNWSEINKLLEYWNIESKEKYDKLAEGLVRYVGKTGDPIAFLVVLKYFNLHRKLSREDIAVLASKFKLNPNNSLLNYEIEYLKKEKRLSDDFIRKHINEILKKILLLVKSDLKHIKHPNKRSVLLKTLNIEEILSLLAYHTHRVTDADLPTRRNIVKNKFVGADGQYLIRRCFSRIMDEEKIKEAFQIAEKRATMNKEKERLLSKFKGKD